MQELTTKNIAFYAPIRILLSVKKKMLFKNQIGSKLSKLSVKNSINHSDILTLVKGQYIGISGVKISWPMRKSNMKHVFSDQ